MTKLAQEAIELADRYIERLQKSAPIHCCDVRKKQWRAVVATSEFAPSTELALSLAVQALADPNRTCAFCDAAVAIENEYHTYSYYYNPPHGPHVFVLAFFCDGDECKVERDAWLNVIRSAKRLGKVQRQCAQCKRMNSDDEPKFPLCTGCRIVYYCSEECQRSAWSAHKSFCRNARK
jgi:hypothetical protein